MKSIIAFTILVLFHFNTSAQLDDRPFILALAPQASFPLGDFKTTNKPGFGGHIVLEWKAGSNTRAVASFGGSLYDGKENDIQDLGYEYPMIAVTQLKGGGKYFFLSRFFVAGQAGFAHVVNPRGENKFCFNYMPYAGIEVGNGGLDFSVKYDVMTYRLGTRSKLSAFGFSIGYHI